MRSMTERWTEPAPRRDAARDRIPNREELRDRATQALAEMIRRNPGIRPFITNDGVTGGRKTITEIERLVQENPHLITELESAHNPQDPDQVTMLVMPVNPRTGRPVVISRSAIGLTGFTPILGCTHQALDRFAAEEHLRTKGDYAIVTSDNRLMPRVGKIAQSGTDQILKYQSGMKPADYIALGAQGALYDEVYRVNLRKYARPRK